MKVLYGATTISPNFSVLLRVGQSLYQSNGIAPNPLLA